MIDRMDEDLPPPTPAASPPTARRRRRARWLVLPALLLVYAGWQAFSIHRYGFRDDGRAADCAIVLGTAAWHHKPSPVLQERINHAIRLYREDRVSAIVLTGGFGEGAPRSESRVAYDYCLEQGIPAEDLLLEEVSHTTYENLVEAEKLLQRENLRSALVVSDPWHLKRAVLIARRLGIDASQSGTTTSRYESFQSRANFVLRELYLYHLFLILGR